ncbi:MAG: sensor histidine kinase [Phycisphaerae bacterium]
MNELGWAVVGAVVTAPLWIAGTLFFCRRLWKNVRRLTARARSRDHLHDQITELGQLAGGLAHEIKNPLSTINVNLSLLAEDLERYTDEEHQRALRRLHHLQDEANRLREILDDFLRFAGKYELALQPVDLRLLVEQLTDFFLPQAGAAGAVMRTSLPDKPIRAEVDTNLLKQALFNLLINAVQAMPEGGELLIRLTEDRGHAQLEVIDTGTGIEPEQLEKIWEVYHSTKKGGTGLGLPTTRRIIHEHRGNIRVESEQGKGTRFIIRLPQLEG